MSFTAHLTPKPFVQDATPDIEMNLAICHAESVWKESVRMVLKGSGNAIFIHFSPEQWAQFKTLVGNSLENDETRVEYTFKGGKK